MSDSLVDRARNGLATAVGLGVLVVQNAQVQRRELAKVAPKLATEVSVAVGDRLKTVAEKLADLGDHRNGAD
jgi:hypothetical protein